jgi:Ca2+-binding RTX toxin-like protein
VIVDFLSSAPLEDKAREGEAVTVAGIFTDVDTVDTHTAIIDWGDATQTSANIDELAGTFDGSHVYTSGGIYTITVTLTDNDGGVASASTTAFVSGVGVNGGVLYIMGTSEDDRASVNQSGNGKIKVHADFLSGKDKFRTFSLSEIDTLIAYLCGGDDHLTIAGNVAIPSIIHAGEGDDHINAGGGPGVLLGGLGDDMLVGGNGRNILIGGTGADRLVGGKNDDVLIGGSTTDDANDEALMALMAKWTSADDYDDRVSAIDLLLSVEDDEEEDMLTGSSGRDLFYEGLGDILTDVKTKKNAETVL